MAEFKTNTLVLDHKFDQKRNRHYLNGKTSVLHCHHYSTLYTQLALDAGEETLLKEVAEDSFIEMLKDYFCKNEIKEIDDRIDLACQMFGALGLGKMEVNYLGDDSGEVILRDSHVDKGWLKKWGKYDRAVNYIGCGYVAAMFSAVLGKEARCFNAIEIESIATGNDISKFKVFKA